MPKRGRKVFFALITAGVLVTLGLSLNVAAGSSPAGETLQVQLSGTVSDGGRNITYSITLVNSGTAAVSDIYVAGTIPTGTKFVEATATPSGAWFKGSEGGNAVWLAGSVAGGAKLGPFSYKVSVTKSPAGAARAWVNWQKPSEGSATSADVSWVTAVSAGGPRRGCQACHVLIDPKTGKYTLLYEAIERSAAAGEEHPTVALDGTTMTFETQVETCLTCHKPGTDGKGYAAPLSLRDIIHPAHLFSTTFVEHYQGNCFTCHNVAGDGVFELLDKKVDVNEKGVPNDEKLPIPGALRPSETWK